MTAPNVPEVRNFLDRLAADNSRDFFQAHKAEYEATLKRPAEALLAALAPRLAAASGHAAEPKLFRANRDVRFSGDKTPYTTHLHMMWRLEAGGRQDPVFFFGIDRDALRAGIGVMGFDPPVLADWRRIVDLDADRVAGLVAQLTGAGFTLREPDLKRVPPPCSADHPMERLLRMKGFVAVRTLSPDEATEDGLFAVFVAGRPALTLLDSVL